MIIAAMISDNVRGVRKILRRLIRTVLGGKSSVQKSEELKIYKI